MQTINLDLTPSSVPSVVHASQFDVGREIGFYLYEDGEEYTIPSGATVYVEGTKSDNHAFSYSSADESSVIVFSGNVVSIATTEQMTAAAGNARCEIKIKTDDATLYTANFILGVESSALPSDSDMSATDIPMIKKAADAGDKIDTLSDKIDKVEELIKQVEDNVTSAETSAANAKTSETNAAASATSASSSASAAETSATNAANSATAAKNSQTSAASYATQAKNQATNAATSATNAANSATASADSAKLSESWAVGGTSSRSGEDTNNSKYYAEQAAKSAQEAAGSITGVATWNGRAGAVTPQKGDYTADMVGLGVKSITVSPTGWSTSATTINGTAYYTYAVTGLTIDDDHPEVSIGVSGTATLPTADEQTAFECIKYGVASGSTLTLYAESVPETSFVINVRGVS